MDKQSYNWRYLQGMKHITDDVYQLTLIDEGIFIEDWKLFTPSVNDEYISQNPEKNQAYVNKLLAKNGLLNEDGGV